MGKKSFILFRFAPFGVCSIITSKLVAMEDISQKIENIGLFIITVFLTCIIFGFIFLPIVYAIFLRRNPFGLLTNVSEALLTGFGTGAR